MTRGSPVWLTGPTRFAMVDRPVARLWLAAMAVALVAAAALAPEASGTTETWFEALTAAMRHGSGYYDALADLLRSDPHAGAERLHPPALVVVAAAIPGWALTALVAAALSALLWGATMRLASAFARSAGVIAVAAAMVVGVIAGGLLSIDAPHAGMAAILTATALVLRRHDRWGTSCALACAAGVIDPAALPAVGAFGLLALIDGTRREAFMWLVAVLIGGIVLGAHLLAVAALGVVPGVAPGEPAVATAASMPLVAAALPGVPAWLAAPALLLATLGWAAWPDGLGLRVAVLMGLGTAGESLFGLHSATLATILVASGLAFVPDALADLLRIAVDRRRITVTRIVR